MSEGNSLKSEGNSLKSEGNFKGELLSDNFETSSAFVTVHKVAQRGGNLMYIIFEDRAAFDLIDLPMTDHGLKPHGHVITKNIEHEQQYLVFQFWIEKPKP
jgi:hypothetical protein